MRRLCVSFVRKPTYLPQHFSPNPPEWYSYELPGGATKKSWKGRFHGQRQKWFALRFVGDESEIDIETPAGGHRPEFDAWRWEEIGRLAELIVPFKRPVYEKVVETFAPSCPPGVTARKTPLENYHFVAAEGRTYWPSGGARPSGP